VTPLGGASRGILHPAASQTTRRRHDPADYRPYSQDMTILAVTTPTTGTRYSVYTATEAAQVRAAQRLRHRVFAQELGARLRTGAPGLDVDDLDDFCDHLVISEDASGDVVGTYRMLPPGRTERLYADGEFDLTGLAPLRDALVEAGRSCVHRDHRSGAVINLLWSGIARYMQLAGYRWLAGCASVPLIDGGATAAAVWRLAEGRHLAPPPLRVRPHRPWPLPDARSEPGASSARDLAAAPLLRGYLRLGAWVCGPPAHDLDFGTADFFVLLSLDRANPRYLRHFLRQP
jgi:putative hemolysin